ncbi:HlyD family efflux transporter periplasmic adaptor subunit [Massilia forsythiae]|uniref:HlyD family efflux transporter periplasmic adaptor subunit n=1 Tax=Massilia forsythiae TaxID=2728020 RepID=A0A7Z2VTJ5_9BURK|nr:HlyD family efflux transporter periplasmic adaptor subunit [Massilia forsythiae]QJD98940.1 HlyD family efflux transporter periplasmic adaptor subunit [Massilia forsythiae]
MSTATTTNATTSTSTPAPNPNKRRFVLLGITAAFVAAGLAYGAYYTLVASRRVETDNAYVGGNLVNVSSQVSGSVIAIRADETQLVKAGAEIVRLDPSDAEVALAQAEARLGSVVRQERERYAGVDQQQAVVEQRRVALKTAQEDLARRAPLAADNVVSGEDVAHARRAVDDAKAALAVAQRQLAGTRVAVAGVAPAQHPAVLAARADYLSAWLAARRNAIVAPVGGYVAKRSVQVGSRIAPGAPLLSIVPLDQLWVDANFKESELRDIRVGQPATIEADIYGGKVTYHGKVVGLGAGTGSAFSLLPAQNASGNWIKVVQRVPVRISLDPRELAAHPLRVGLSATVDVDISNDKGGALGTAAMPAPTYATTVLAQPLQQAQAATDAIVARNMAN